MTTFSDYYDIYTSNLARAFDSLDRGQLEAFADAFFEVWKSRGTVYLIGNGGSAGNSIHIANDLLYGASNPKFGGGVKAVSLAANTSILTCLGNDLGYSDIFSTQLKVYGEKEDLLLVLSGSGNSANVVKGIAAAKEKGMVTAAILGFEGGLALDEVDIPLHFRVADMQLSEDLQLVLMHALMQYARKQK
jgi:D-sedoheptulose 7-phosphate isomerase